MTDWTDALAEPTPAEIEAVARALAGQLVMLGDESPAAVYNDDGYRVWLNAAARVALTADPLRAALMDVVRAVSAAILDEVADLLVAHRGESLKRIRATPELLTALAALKGLVA